MKTSLRVLIVEDSEDDFLLLTRQLRRGGYDLFYERVDTPQAMSAALDDHEWDIILSDYSMPHFSALAALTMIQEKNIDLPFIIVSGTVGEDVAVAAMKAGAHDFFAKDKLVRLIPAVERELRDAKARQRQRWLQQQLRQSEERFIKAFQASPVAITIITAEGIFLDANEGFIQLFGYQHGEIMGRTLFELDIWHNTDSRASVEQILTGQHRVRNLEIQCRTRNGDIRSILASFERIDLEGEICLLALFHDVTGQKQAQDELRVLYNAVSYLFRADSFHSLAGQIVQAVVQEFEHSDCGLLIVEQDQLIRLARRGSSAVTTEVRLNLNGPGLVAEAARTGTTIYAPDVSQHPLYLPNAPATRSELAVPLRTANRVVGVLDLQSTELGAFGEREQRILLAFAERAANAIEIMQLYEELNQYAADLEARVMQRTAELYRAKEHVEAILNNSSDAVIVLNTEGKIQEINPAFARLFGYESNDVYQLPLAEIVHVDDAAHLVDILDQVTYGQPVERLDIIVLHRSGEQIAVDLALSAIKDPEGQPVSIVCTLHDITERKRTEEELRKAFENERELNQLKSRFVSMVSHEYRTPLAIILSSTGLVKHYHDRMTDEKRNLHLSEIEVQVKRLSEMLDDVLTLNKASTATLPFNPTEVDLVTFCREVAHDIQLTAHATHQIILSNSESCIHTNIDEKLMRQVVSNLLSNAIKYSPQGGNVYFNIHCTSEHTLLQVRDHGVGIPEDDQKRLFEAFFRAQNVDSITGTGLGLSITKRAVEMHNGSISFESEIGIGTTFTVTLPLL